LNKSQSISFSTFTGMRGLKEELMQNNANNEDIFDMKEYIKKH